MAPSSFKKIGAAAAAVACATTAVSAAATESYQLSEEYTAANFFDKFDFFTSTYTSGDSWDDTHGYVQYRGQAEAESMGLISSSTASGHVYIGPDANSTYDPAATGRDSVRITSKAVYNEGLMVAKFAHMPVQACGAWPAFWSFGAPWLTLGEIDYYEGWNEMGYNRMALHTNGTLGGECALTTTGIGGTVLTDDCVNGEDMTGCGVQDDSGVWGSTTGATFAMEWTDAAIKIWSWVPSAVPADITDGAPDPTAWGSPTLLVEQTNCDLGRSFGNQQLVFNIDFCGDTAGSDTFWNQTCLASTGGATCASYVANNPAAFAESYFLVEGIQYYEMGVAEASVAISASAAAEASTQAAVTAAAVTTDAIPPHHTTSYIYGTSTSTDESGSETTVVVVVDTTICPITAAEASASSLLASESNAAVAAQTTPAKQPVAVASISHTPHTTLTSYSTSTSVALTTSTIFSTSASTITSCASTASLCNVGDVTTVVIAVSTTICPVTAADGSASSSVVAHPTRVPVFAPSKEPTNSPVQATASPSAIAPSAAWGPFPNAATAAPASSKSIVWTASVVFSNPPVQATASFAGALPSAPASSGASASENSPVHASASSGLATDENSPVKATASAEPSPFSIKEVSPSTGVVVPTSSSAKATDENSPVKATAHVSASGTSTNENSPVKATAPGTAASENSPVKATAASSSSAASTTKSTLSTTTTAKTTSSEDSDIAATAASTEVITATETGGGLELATEKPTSISLAWLTEVTAAATASSSGNGTATGASEAAEETNTCSGVDCIVVSSSGSRRDVVGDSGLALVVVAGAMFLF